MEKKKTVAVMVLYHPEKELLKKNIDAILPQVEKLYIVDNTPANSPQGATSPLTFDKEKIRYFGLGINRGIAMAQNIGIEHAIYDGAEMIYFLDQDSISPNDIIKRLTGLYDELTAKGVKVGSLGALPINRATGEPYIQTTPSAEGIEGITEVKELISSGSIIPRSVILDIGGMREELFIDGVDHEWCWRGAGLKGYRFFVDNNSRLSHQLGRGDRQLGWRKVAIPSPIRTYYLYRNIFILNRLGYVPKSFKVKNGIKLALKIFYYPIFISPRLQYAKYIFKGIKDGLTYEAEAEDERGEEK